MNLQDEFNRLSAQKQLQLRSALAVLLGVPITDVPLQLDAKWADQTCVADYIDLVELIKKHVDDDEMPSAPVAG